MAHASTCLTRDEWVKALETSQAEMGALGERLMLAGETARPDLGHIDGLLQRLVSMAATDPGYAWWAANNYAQLGEDWKENPYAELPARLTNHMKSLKEQQHESA